MTIQTLPARKEMIKIARGVVAQFPGLVAVYQGVDTDTPPKATTDWVRVDVLHSPDQFQASLSGPTSGAKRWRRTGVIVVQCFAQIAPLNVPNDLLVSIDKAMLYACAFRDAYQGWATDSGIWFRNPDAREIGREQGWYQANATINFEYDEVR